MLVMVMIVNDDLDDARDNGDDDEDDLSLREEFSPAEFSRREGIFISVGFRHGVAAELRKLFCPLTFRSRGSYRPKESTGGGTHTQAAFGAA